MKMKLDSDYLESFENVLNGLSENPQSFEFPIERLHEEFNDFSQVITHTILRRPEIGKRKLVDVFFD